VPDSSVLDLSSTGTITAWVKLNSTPSAGSLYTIISEGGSGGNYGPFHEIYNTSGGPKLCLWQDGTINQWTCGTTDFNSFKGQWVFTASVWDGTTTKIYVNGNIENTASRSGSTGNGTKWGIGRNPYNNSRFFNGLIDDVRIYDRALSRDEIIADMQEGALGKKVLHLKFDEENASIRDFSSFNNFGKLNGNTRLLIHFDENAGYLAQDESGYGNIGTIHGNTALLMNFDDNSSSTIKDLSGNGNNGTLYGSTRLLMHMDDASGQTVGDSTGYGNDGTYKGSSLSFNGSSDYVGFGSNKTLSTGAWTASLWFRNSEVVAGSLYNFIGDSGWTTNSAYFCVYQSKIALWNKAGQEGAKWYYGDTTIVADTWYHATLTSDGSGNYQAYLNGQPDGTWANMGTDDDDLVVQFIGRGSTARWYKGNLDEVRIYNRTLSTTEIQNLYHGTEPSSSGLVGLWHFDEGTGTAVGDDSGQGNNGTLTGATWSTESPAIWQSSGADESNSGGSALAFNGVDNYVDAGSGYTFVTNYPFTVEAWVRASTDAGTGVILSAWEDASNRFQLEWLGTLGEIGAYHTIGGTGDRLRTDGANLNSDVWYHIVAVANAGLDVDAYVNGISVGGFDTGHVLTDPPTVAGINIGRNRRTAALVSYFNGSIDEVEIHARALTEAEILDRYNSKKAKFSDWNAGKSGQGLKFDGNNDYVNVVNDTSLEPASTISFGAWIKIEGNGSHSDGTYILTKGRAGSQPYNSYGIKYIPDTDKIRCTVGVSGTSRNVDSTSNFTPVSDWVHVVCTYDGTDIRIYIDGSYDTSSNYSGSITYGLATDNDLHIGDWGYLPSYTRRFEGKIDEVAVYSKALPADEIAEQYNLGKAKHSDWVAGKSGTGLEFDGVDDFVDVGDVGAINTGAISFWVKLNSLPAEQYLSFYGINSVGYARAIRLTNNQLGFVGWGGATNEDIYNIYTMSAGTWYNIAYTFDGHDIKVYVDGDLKASETKTGLGTISNGSFLVGKRGPSYNESYLNGSIDEVAVYSKALSADEISKHYAAGRARHSDFDAGISGKVIQFDGVDDYVQTSAVNNLAVGTSPRTIEFWMYSETSPSDLQSLVGYGDNSAGSGKLFMVALGYTQSRIQLWGNTNNLQGTKAINQNQWYHVAVTYNGADVSIYVDGELDISGVVSLDTPNTSVSKTVRMGFDVPSGSYSHFDGALDDVRVYNYAKSAQEIEADYNASKVGYFNALEGWWPLNEIAQSTTATDVSGNNNNGTLNNFDWSADSNWASGKYGGGLKFDGVNDFVDATNISSSGDVTFEAWIYPTTYAAAPAHNPRVFHNYDGSNDLQIILKESDYFVWGTTTGAAGVGVATEPSLNTWTHIVATRLGSTYKVYYNGIEQSTTAATPGNPVPTTQALRIGADIAGTSNNGHFNGSLDDVRIYSRAKSASEIYADYNAQKHKYHAHIDPMDTNLVGLWHLDGFGNSKTAMDSSMQGNHGELVNFDFWEQDSGWVEGKYGDALEFNGDSGTPRVPDSNSLHLSNEISIEAWVKPFALSEWKYRKSITIDNTGNASALTDYQIKVVVPFVSGKMNSDFSDLRFYDEDGSKLSYWIETYTASSSATVWLRVPSIPASSTKTIYLYYGNPSAMPESDGEGVFEFFDDFDDGSIDSSKWTQLSGTTWVEEGGVLKEMESRQSGDSGEADIYYPGGFSWTDYIFEGKLYADTSSYPGVFVRVSDASISSTTAWWHEWNTSGGNGTLRPFVNNTDYSWAYTWTGTTPTDTGMWRDFRVDVWGDNYKSYLNGVVVNNLQPVDSAHRISSGTIGLGEHQGYTSPQKVYFDDVRVRQYTATEPTASLGVEESVSTTYIARKGSAFALDFNGTHLNGTVNASTLSSSIDSGKWHHAVLTYNGSTQKLYLNGALADSTSLSGSINSDSNALVFGQLFNGLIDEVAIFEHALTERDVKDHYYAFVNKGGIYSPGAIKAFEGS